MMKATVFVSVATLLMGTAQVFAQAAIGSPGTYSFYCPDRDVLNGGAPVGGQSTSAETALESVRHVRLNTTLNSAAKTFCALRFRSFDPQSSTYLGRDGRRHHCE